MSDHPMILVLYPVSRALSILLLPFLLASQTRFAAPSPRYQVDIEQNIRVPMRDGVRLATDIYRPAGVGGKLPAIMIRTPYNRKSAATEARMFAGQGYAVVVQDVRGKYDSEGTFTVSANDTRDGSDLLDWISAQPWATGKTGTYGCSYVGEDQIELGKVRHPNQTAMIAQAAGGAYRFAGLMTGGALELAMASEWFYKNGNKTDPRAKPGPPKAPLWDTLPVIDILRKAGGPQSDWEDWVSHAPGDAWWEKFGYVNDRNRFNAPALQICSWYDNVVKSTLDVFNLLSRNAESADARENQFVIISPTTHCRSERATDHTTVGALDFGDAQLDYQNIYVKWFDHFLKGEDNGILQMPKVQIYVMGRNSWRGEKEWPLARTRYTRFYLRSDGHANSSAGTGTLSVERPGAEASDRFVYDPGNPVPTTGGAICCSPNPKNPDGPLDQREVEKRADVLVYSTPVLNEGVEITGPIEATLYVSSDAKDTDFTAKLVDVHADGSAYTVQEGILRARYRDGLDKKLLMKEGAVYPVKIDLMATSLYFAPGHRIRLEISSSNFPRFDRNLNTGGNNYDETRWQSARNVIWHSGSNASYLLLPVIPD
jgi:putative CocE/NonD family hydrolase